MDVFVGGVDCGCCCTTLGDDEDDAICIGGDNRRGLLGLLIWRLDADVFLNIPGPMTTALCCGC